MLQIAAVARRGLEVAQRAPDQRHAAPGVLRRHRHRSRPGPRCWRSRSPRPGPPGCRSASDRLRRTSPSEPECPSTMALVLSHTIASTPSSPSAANAASSVGGPTSGLASSFQSPVCSTMPPACGSPAPAPPGWNAPRAGTAGERRQLEATARGITWIFTSFSQLRLAQLAPQHGGGERRGIDRAAQLRHRWPPRRCGPRAHA